MPTQSDERPLKLRISCNEHRCQNLLFETNSNRHLLNCLPTLIFSNLTSEMACGCQMAMKAFQLGLDGFCGIWNEPIPRNWPFKTVLEEIASTKESTNRRESLLNAIWAGSKIQV